MTWKEKVQRLPGPILVLGASGFVGANLLKNLLAVRSDVYGTVLHFPAWRLADVPEKHVLSLNVLAQSNLHHLLESTQPRVVFNCIAYGAYSFETDFDLIYRTNLQFVSHLVEALCNSSTPTWLIQAGSSSEYGHAAKQPSESQLLTPNSHYSVSKGAVAGLLHYAGKHRQLPCANLRLYSVYGPLEDSSRLIPNVLIKGQQQQYPPFVNPEISRDFVYVDDVCDAFVSTVLELKETHYGESFNIGTGTQHTIKDIAFLSKELFNISTEPQFESMPNRSWDVSEWYADPSKAKQLIHWKATTSLKEGLSKTQQWLQSVGNLESYQKSSKQFDLDTKHSVSAIIACYKDGQAIPIMYERLVEVFNKLSIDYEIIFVNDNSPDDSESVIQEISKRDHRVIGINHSRNFGSQAAFRSGMEIASKNACVLMDGDLQDPPEMIEPFVEKWKEGYDVVYGDRIEREAPWYMQIAYKLFYRVFDRFSYIHIPRDAGDFSLMDKRVVWWLLKFPERDLFLRGLRAYAGFKQTGVPYKRPERMFGVSTNNFFRNLGWAKKGILSFSNTPLNILSFIGVSLFSVSVILLFAQFFTKLFFPQSAPAGITTVILLVGFFGSLNMLGLSLIGEYIAKIFEEVKARPHFIRRSLIRDGEIQKALDGKQARS